MSEFGGENQTYPTGGGLHKAKWYILNSIRVKGEHYSQVTGEGGNEVFFQSQIML